MSPEGTTYQCFDRHMSSLQDSIVHDFLFPVVKTTGYNPLIQF